MTSKPRMPRVASAAPESESAVAPIPQVWTDPAATVASDPLVIEVLGRTWSVPAMSAAEWLELVWMDRLTFYDIFPGLIGDDDGFFTDAMVDGLIDLDEMFGIAKEIIEAASGLRWWFCLNLSVQAKANWHHLSGSLTREGLDPRTTPYGMWLLAFLSLCLENMKPEKAAMFVTELNTPPKGSGVEKDNSDDGAAFLSAMRQAL